MLARRSLPDGYVLSGTVRLHRNRKLLLILLLLSVPWTLASVGVLRWLASLVRPQGWTFGGESTMAALAGLAATVVITIVVHEGVHGILMWIFTKARPVFGFKGWYAYADAPGWYFQRWPMVAVLVAPLIVLPAIGLPLIALMPAGLSMLVLVGLILNMVAAIGDIYMTGVVLWVRGPVYFGDAPDTKPGEAGGWYQPAS